MSTSFACLSNNFRTKLSKSDARELYAAASTVATARVKEAFAFLYEHKVGFLSYAVGAGLTMLVPGMGVRNAALAAGAFMHPLFNREDALQSREKFADSISCGAADVLGVGSLAAMALGLGGCFILTSGCLGTGVSPEVHIGNNVTYDSMTALHGDVSLDDTTLTLAVIQTGDHGHIDIDDSTIGLANIQADGDIVLKNVTIHDDVGINVKGNLVAENTIIDKNVNIDVAKDGSLTIKGSDIEGQYNSHYGGKASRTVYRDVDIYATGNIDNTSIKIEPFGRVIDIRNDVILSDATVTGGSLIEGPDTSVVNSLVDGGSVKSGEHLVQGTRTPRPLFSFG